jgi:hypothetical protein
MKILLILVLIMADGPRETALEMPTLDECWARAQAVIAKADVSKMQDAGVRGIGAGCIVEAAPTQESGR